MLMQFRELAVQLLEVPPRENEPNTLHNIKIDVDLIRLAEILTYIISPDDEFRRARMMTTPWAMVAKWSPDLEYIPVGDTTGTLRILTEHDSYIRSNVRSGALGKHRTMRTLATVWQLRRKVEAMTAPDRGLVCQQPRLY